MFSIHSFEHPALFVPWAQAYIRLLIQDIEKEKRKEVDEAIAKAKVWIMVSFFDLGVVLILVTVLQVSGTWIAISTLYSSIWLQESPMPDPSELFTNVYVKGYGIEV